MPKTKETDVQPKKFNIKKLMIKTTFVLVVGATAYGLFKNPEIVSHTRDFFAEKPNQNTELLAQMQTMQYEIEKLKNASQPMNTQDAAVLNERFSALEKNNLNIIDSKADVATVLGLLTRLDKAENKLDNMAKITDEGALILTSAVLVKDSADRGESFEYEAEVLQEISKDNVRFKEPVEKIVAFAAEGINTKSYLINEFESIYKALLKEQKEEFEKTWKDRLNSKLNEIIKVKRVNEEAPEFQANQELEIVRAYVKSGELAKAVKDLVTQQNADLLKNQKLAIWLEQVKKRTEFEAAISKISASSLAIMKVNFIKKETKND